MLTSNDEYQRLIKSFNEYLDYLKDSSQVEIEYAINYLKWTSYKTIIMKNRNIPKSIPISVIPQKITQFAYERAYNHDNIISNYYSPNYYQNSIISYSLNTNVNHAPQNDLELLIDSFVLTRGNVVWIEFGHNIGSEFSDRHPGIILKHKGDNLLVQPLTSTPLDLSKSHNICIGIIGRFTPIKQYVNVTRIKWISKVRIDLNAKIGFVKKPILDEISNLIKIHNY